MFTAAPAPSLELFTWTTPNGIKPLILLEELGEPYQLHWVDIGAGAQHQPSFLQVNPNAKIPALRDAGLCIFESGALLMHLAEKYGRFLPAAGPQRAQTLSWLFFQVGGIGPMFGQLGHFMHLERPIPYAIERYRNEAERLYGVLDQRLGESEYLAGEYSIADIASFGWAARHAALQVSLTRYPHVQRWLNALAARPAVVRARALRP
ncbi:MAG TPA: glutathione S-transferase N-terminal domain-containing protein [Polyangiales bacterium]